MKLRVRVGTTWSTEELDQMGLDCGLRRVAAQYKVLLLSTFRLWLGSGLRR